MILDAFLLKSCSKAAPAALGGCGGLGQLWEALAELWEALAELLEALGELWEGLYIENSRSTAPAAVMLIKGAAKGSGVHNYRLQMVAYGGKHMYRSCVASRLES